MTYTHNTHDIHTQHDIARQDIQDITWISRLSLSSSILFSLSLSFSFLSFERSHGVVCPRLIGSSLPATHGGTRCHSRRSTSTGSKSSPREIKSHTAPCRFGIVVAGVAVHVVCHVGRLRRQQLLETLTELVDWSKVLQTLGVSQVVA